ncbi:hypothetical protein RFI_14327 [Reticulomyxa filosa]|uniref:Generative cell specific-1/HAP2 domain-containing protein n=1 Tax=Reticulomyxa filosa TaxID=46433 RepID=X6NA49_RETFI|nr:hypothetical protein RFI_14327 [Reticulomyxa filosa]|eukprot:ETO22866.1 hypothetical protein RFI_14327 [Reticulomyxa filosa]
MPHDKKRERTNKDISFFFFFFFSLLKCNYKKIFVNTYTLSNRAGGYIKNCTINNFEALAEHAVAQCYIKSTGAVEAIKKKVKANDEFAQVTITNCTQGITPLLGQQATIPAGSMQVFSFDVYSENPLQSSHTCVVGLYDSMEKLIDNITIQFTSYALQTDKVTYYYYYYYYSFISFSI